MKSGQCRRRHSAYQQGVELVAARKSEASLTPFLNIVTGCGLRSQDRGVVLASWEPGLATCTVIVATFRLERRDLELPDNRSALVAWLGDYIQTPEHMF